jgi:hypothetical protein
MTNVRAGLLSGLIAVLVTSAVNIVCRLLSLLPDAMDMKYMAELIIDPAQSPVPAFWFGLVLHIIGGTLIGLIFVLLIKQPTPLKGIGFSLLTVWLSMMLLVFPLRGRGFFGMNIGIVMPISTFLLNVIYGLIVGAVAQRQVSLLPETGRNS